MDPWGSYPLLDPPAIAHQARLVGRTYFQIYLDALVVSVTAALVLSATEHRQHLDKDPRGRPQHGPRDSREAARNRPGFRFSRPGPRPLSPPADRVSAPPLSGIAKYSTSLL